MTAGSASGVGGGRFGGPAAPQVIPSVVEDVTVPALAAAESLATKDVIDRASPGYLVLDPGTLTNYKARYAGRN